MSVQRGLMRSELAKPVDGADLDQRVGAALSRAQRPPPSGCNGKVGERDVPARTSVIFGSRF